MQSRNTGPYTVAELNDLVKNFKYLAYHPARGGDQSDFLACRIPVPNADARAIARELEAKFDPLFPELMISFAAKAGGDRITLNVENGEKPGNLESKHFPIAERFEKELEKALLSQKLKMERHDDSAYSFIPGP